ncbi:MAG: ATP-binding protein [Gammaproteobacteria bacterium]|jgi:C4-dicarboxylate-specific signal transduction histidine kinase
MESKKIMVVEDEATVGMTLIEKLQKAGYTVAGNEAIFSGEEAVARVEELQPDLILMDIMLRDKMDGIEAAKLIKEKFDVPIVYLTAYADQELLDRAKITEPFAYIVKPFVDRELFINIEIALYRHQVETTVKEKNQQLLIQAEKMGALGLFAAGTAHELNNPLMGILNYVEFCIKKTSDDDKVHQVLLDTKKEVDRCIDIVKNLLTFAPRPISSESFKQTAIVKLVDNVLKLLDYKIVKEKIKVNVEFPQDGLEAPIIADSIQQVFLNLVINAIDALKSSENKEIKIYGEYKNDEAVIVISDTGCGIPNENMDKIFQPFFTTKESGKGTGLGLSIVKDIISEHRGEVTCESKVGTGTTFTIHLPKA